MKESLCILVVLMAIVLQSCSHDRRLTRRPGKRKPQTVDQVKTSNVPSEEWEIVTFGYGEMGYQTEDGDVKIKGDYSFCRKFNDGYASVRDKSRNMGIIDEEGNEVIPFEYQYTSNVGSGLVAIRKKRTGKVGYVNLKNRKVVDFKYDMGFAMSDGMGRVAVGRYQDYLNLKHYEDCKYGFINKKGKEVIEPQFDWAGDFVDGMAPASKNGRYYFIDKSGQPIDDKTYTRLSGFKGDLCWVKKGSKGGFMNKKNEIVLPLEYDNYMYFFDRGSKFQTTNLESELGESLFQNDDGFFVVSKSDDEWGIVNEDNKVLTEFIYSDIGIPKEGFVEIEKRSGKGLGRYIRGRIMEVVPCKFDYIYHHPGNDYVIVGIGDYGIRKTGLYNTNGEVLVEPKYNDVKFSGKGVYGVKIGGLWAILKGDELITDAVYDYVGDYSNGAVYVTKDDEVFYVDRRGRERKSR